jgi:uncharacterized lipoprotein YmbA
VTNEKGKKKKTTTVRKESDAAGKGAQQTGARGVAASAVAGKKKVVEKTPDGHHVLIDGRRWRATDPNIPEELRQQLVNELMRARRDVGRALRAGDAEAVSEARSRVHACKVALGERGAKWWDERKG